MKQQKGCSEQSKLWFLFFLFFSLDCQEIILCAKDNFVVHNRQFSGFACVVFFFHILFTMHRWDHGMWFSNIKSKNFNPLTLINNSPHTLPYSSCDVSLENLVLDQPIIPN